jgi:hypothetical protein
VITVLLDQVTRFRCDDAERRTIWVGKIDQFQLVQAFNLR